MSVTPLHNREIVEALETLLERAKSGDIVSVGWVIESMEEFDHGVEGDLSLGLVAIALNLADDIREITAGEIIWMEE